MTKMRQFFAGVVIGLGAGIGSMIGFEITQAINASQEANVVVFVSTDAEFPSTTKNTIHLNENAHIDMSQIAWMPEEMK